MKRLGHEPRQQEFGDRTKHTKQQVLDFIWVWPINCECVCVFVLVRVCILRLCMYSHLFENHELIQEINTLAGKQLPDGLLLLEAMRVRGGAELGGLVLQELRQRVVLHAETETETERCFTIKRLH